LIVLPTVIYGGVSLLALLVGKTPGYFDNPMRQNLFRAGHAHAGVLLVLSLVVLHYVDDARLSTGWKRFACSSTPLSAILLPAGFFLSILSPTATAPSALIYLCIAGAVLLAFGLVVLGIGLLRAPTGNS